MNSLAERIVMFMVGAEILFEDRMDDLVAKYGERIPGSTPESKRQTLEHWASYDPTRNKKYFPWMIKQWLGGKLQWGDPLLDHIRDLLNDFEHYITMPAFKEPRDIFQYDYTSLNNTMAANSGLASKRDLKRGRESLGGAVLNKVGNIEVVGFKDGNSLAEEAWRGYAKENPNWDGPPHYPTDPEYVNAGKEPYSVDSLWCIRNPKRGADYIAQSPSKQFYVIRKDGWPYIGIVMGGSGSQIVNLHNRQIDASQVEEIYDALVPVLDEYAAKKWDTGHAANSLFGKLRIIRGELKPGETIAGVDLSKSSLSMLPDGLTVSGDLNVSGTKLKALPNNLTVKGSLIISNTGVTQLPAGLKVTGNLNLSGTKITALPQGMKVGTLDIANTPITQLPSGLEADTLHINGTKITSLPDDLKATKIFYSPETISDSEIRRYFFWLRKEDLRKHFWSSSKTATMPEAEKAAEWEKFAPALLARFQVLPTIAHALAAMFEPVHAEPKKKKRK